MVFVGNRIFYGKVLFIGMGKIEGEVVVEWGKGGGFKMFIKKVFKWRYLWVVRYRSWSLGECWSCRFGYYCFFFGNKVMYIDIFVGELV